MSKDKNPSIFSPQMEAVAFIILQIFFATRASLKIEEYQLFHERALAITNLISNKREWNNCLLKTSPKYKKNSLKF